MDCRQLNTGKYKQGMTNDETKNKEGGVEQGGWGARNLVAHQYREFRNILNLNNSAILDIIYSFNQYTTTTPLAAFGWPNSSIQHSLKVLLKV